MSMFSRRTAARRGRDVHESQQDDVPPPVPYDPNESDPGELGLFGSLGRLGIIQDPDAPEMDGAASTTTARGWFSPGISHQCAGCAGGEPCDTCGGNIDTGHPAYQALSWGLQTTVQTHDPFWRAVAVQHTVATAPARSNTANTGSGATWTAMDRYLFGVVASQVVSTQGLNAVAALSGAGIPDIVGIIDWHGYDPENLGDLNTPEGRGKALVWPPDWPNPEKWACCPRTFVYGPATRETSTEINDRKSKDPNEVGYQSGPMVGLAFPIEAQFIEGDATEDGGVCKCKCCEFRQVVMHVYLKETPTGGGGGKEPVKEGPFADCVCPKGGGKRVGSGVTAVPPYGPCPDKAAENRQCMGDRTAASGERGISFPEYNKYKKGGSGGDKDDLDPVSGCLFSDVDHVVRGLQKQAETWEFEWASVGLIIDTCRGVIKWFKWLAFEDSGSEGADASVSYDSTDKGGKKLPKTDSGPKKSDGRVK